MPLQQLKNEIYTSLPDLMELGFNEANVETINKYGLHQFNRGRLKLDLVPFEKWRESGEIIGRPITLPDVLRWIRTLEQTKNTPYYINIHEEFMTAKNEFFGKWVGYTIDDQWVELIDLLFNLIEKK